MLILSEKNWFFRRTLHQLFTSDEKMLLPTGKIDKAYLGRVRLGIFRNKNVFRNIFRLFCSWEQNSQNGIQVFPNSSQTNAYLHYSNYSYSGLILNERALSSWLFFSGTTKFSPYFQTKSLPHSQHSRRLVTLFRSKCRHDKGGKGESLSSRMLTRFGAIVMTSPTNDSLSARYTHFALA